MDSYSGNVASASSTKKEKKAKKQYEDGETKKKFYLWTAKTAAITIPISKLKRLIPEELERFTSMRTKKDKERGGGDTRDTRGPNQRHSAAASYELSGQSALLYDLKDESVLELFEQMLVDMNLIGEKQKPLREKDIAIKREMVSQYLHTSKAGQNQKESTKSAQIYIVDLKSDVKDTVQLLGCLESLRISLNSNPVSIMAGKCQHEIIRCLKSFMNNLYGLKTMLATAEGIPLLVRAVNPRAPHMMADAIKLLSAICIGQNQKESTKSAQIYIVDLNWVQNFGEEGLMLLLTRLRRLQDERDENPIMAGKCQHEIIRCLKSFMNNMYGLKTMLATAEGIPLLYYRLMDECAAQIVLHRNGADPDFKCRNLNMDIEGLIDKPQKQRETRGPLVTSSLSFSLLWGSCGARLMCRDRDSMLRCMPETRGYASSGGPAVPIEDSCRGPRPTDDPEKHSEELTLRRGAGLGVRRGPDRLPAEPARSWSLEYGGILGGRWSWTPTSRAMQLLRFSTEGGGARLRMPDNLKTEGKEDPPPPPPPPHSLSDTTALALARSFSFSRSVWFTGPGLGMPPRPPGLARPEVPEPMPDAGSLSLELWGAAAEVGLLSPEPASPAGAAGRAELGRVSVSVLVLAGRGRERYWRDPRALGDRKPLGSLLRTSRLVFRLLPPTGFTGIPDVLGALGGTPVVPMFPLGWCDPLVAVVVAVETGFLKPKFPPVEGRTRPDGGFLCSPTVLLGCWFLCLSPLGGGVCVMGAVTPTGGLRPGLLGTLPCPPRVWGLRSPSPRPASGPSPAPGRAFFHLLAASLLRLPADAPSSAAAAQTLAVLFGVMRSEDIVTFRACGVVRSVELCEVTKAPQNYTL
ncbi:hypothetical protein CRUP_026757 [Coryphaenoides rupestris]|nr:hypothetical protein CRUP_026757 [Coryphaenoides rupestris]